MNKHQITNKGYQVFGVVNNYNPQLRRSNVIRGRIRVVEGNPHFDQGGQWTFEGKAINHNFGDLQLDTKE